MEEHAKKSRFFTPYIGKDYQYGILNKKILVLGASFYCENTWCEYFKECTNRIKKDSSAFDLLCPENCKYSRNLHDQPTYNIKDGHETYDNFASAFDEYLNENERFWDKVAFTNYIQFFLPTKETKRSYLSERDFYAFYETIIELQPDIVIIWGNIINTKLKEKNPYITDKMELNRTDFYLCHIKIPEIKHKICLINCNHPCDKFGCWSREITKFKSYLQNSLTAPL